MKTCGGKIHFRMIFSRRFKLCSLFLSYPGVLASGALAFQPTSRHPAKCPAGCATLCAMMSMSADVPDFVPATLQRCGVTLDDEQLGLLARYLNMLLETNQRVNLTAVREPDAAWRRLILDSLTLVPGLEPLSAEATLIDIGSGGGLPGIPLAIARPDLRFTLLEATGKKTRFLQQCVDELPLKNTTVLNDRAEPVGQNRRIGKRTTSPWRGRWARWRRCWNMPCRW